MKQYYPFCVQIELVQGCNRECYFCGTNGIEKKLHYMNIDTICHIAELLKRCKYKGRILFAGHGEPSLHKQMPLFVGVLHDFIPDAHITMFTNGYGFLKDKDLLKEYFQSGGNAIMFDEYSDNRIKGMIFELPNINDYKVDMLENGTPLFDRKEKRKRVIISKPIEAEGKAINRKLCNHCGAGMPPLSKPLKKKCSIIFRDFFIRWDGNIAICCNDFRGEYPVTNIMKCNTFEEAYYHQRLESARKRLMQNDRGFHPCNICNVVPLRVGLLPDKAGKMNMPLPTEMDYKVTSERMQALAIKRKRDWDE